MAAKVEWTPVALRELEDIAYYIAVTDGRPEIARKVVESIHARAALYAEAPTAGAKCPEAGKDCRRFLYKRWVVIYVPADYGIRVVGIVDAARDFPAWCSRLH